MLLDVLVPRVAAVSLELPWSSEEEELICGLSSSDSSGLACQPQSSLGTRSTGAAIVPVPLARAGQGLDVSLTRGPVRLRTGGVFAGPTQRSRVPSARTAGTYTADVRPSLGLRRPSLLALRRQQ